METKIIKTIKEWLPWAVENEKHISEYALLRKLANYCQQQIDAGAHEKAGQVIKIINLLYAGSSLHEKNAIENEFLEVLAGNEAPATLKTHMTIFPDKLKQAYLKTILEN